MWFGAFKVSGESQKKKKKSGTDILTVKVQLRKKTFQTLHPCIGEIRIGQTLKKKNSFTKKTKE